MFIIIAYQNKKHIFNWKVFSGYYGFLHQKKLTAMIELKYCWKWR